MNPNALWEGCGENRVITQWNCMHTTILNVHVYPNSFNQHHYHHHHRRRQHQLTSSTLALHFSSSTPSSSWSSSSSSPAAEAIVLPLLSWSSLSSLSSIRNALTHCGLVTTYGDIYLGKLWLRNQAITWINFYNVFLLHSPERNFFRNAPTIYPWQEFEKSLIEYYSRISQRPKGYSPSHFNGRVTPSAM